MTSDKDDQDNLDKDLDLGDSLADSDDFIDDDYDPEGIDEPLSASVLGSPEDYDQDSADDFSSEDDGDDEEDLPPKKKSGGMAKIVAPLIVLLAAASAGGYIVMNPSILGGSNLAEQIAAQSEPASPVADTSATLAETPLLPTPEVPADVVTAETPAPLTPEPPAADATVQPKVDPSSPELAANEIPPQPSTNINVEQPLEPKAPDAATVEATAAVNEAALPQATPAVVEEVPVAPADVPVPPADVPAPPAETAAAPAETSASPALDTKAETPKPPETVVASATETPPVDAPVAEAPAAPVTPPSVPETPPAAEPVAPVASEVTQPTFVPAAPDQTTSPVTVASADSAEPPVMNVKEVTGVKTPDMPPRTVDQAPPTIVPAPVTVGGNASAPITQLPADSENNVYYDSLSQVPSGAMAKSVGPREVNPVLEPASKMIIVSKDKSGDSQEAQVVAATRALKLKRYDAALEMFDQLYAKNKRDPRILMGRGIAQQNMGLNESAIQTYEEVLAIKPDNAEALLNMLGLLRSQYPEIALRRLLDLYSAHPNSPGIAAQIGITNAGMGHYEDAMRYLGIASTLEPTNAQHLFNMAIAADRQGEAVKAIELYQRALEVDVMYGSSRSVPRERIYDRLSVLRRG